MEKLFCIFAYKPDSEDYCRGCHMASYSSDFINEINISHDYLIDLLTKIFKKNATLECNEVGYDTPIIFCAETPEDYDWNPESKPKFHLIQEFSDEYNNLIKSIKEKSETQAKEEKAQKEQAEDARRKQEKLERDKREYERLKKQFSD